MFYVREINLYFAALSRQRYLLMDYIRYSSMSDFSIVWDF